MRRPCIDLDAVYRAVEEAEEDGRGTPTPRRHRECADFCFGPPTAEKSDSKFPPLIESIRVYLVKVTMRAQRVFLRNWRIPRRRRRIVMGMVAALVALCLLFQFLIVRSYGNNNYDSTANQNLEAAHWFDASILDVRDAAAVNAEGKPQFLQGLFDDSRTLRGTFARRYWATTPLAAPTTVYSLDGSKGDFNSVVSDDVMNMIKRNQEMSEMDKYPEKHEGSVINHLSSNILFSFLLAEEDIDSVCALGASLKEVGIGKKSQKLIVYSLLASHNDQQQSSYSCGPTVDDLLSYAAEGLGMTAVSEKSKDAIRPAISAMLRLKSHPSLLPHSAPLDAEAAFGTSPSVAARLKQCGWNDVVPFPKAKKALRHAYMMPRADSLYFRSKEALRRLPLPLSTPSYSLLLDHFIATLGDTARDFMGVFIHPKTVLPSGSSTAFLSDMFSRAQAERDDQVYPNEQISVLPTLSPSSSGKLPPTLLLTGISVAHYMDTLDHLRLHSFWGNITSADVISRSNNLDATGAFSSSSILPIHTDLYGVFALVSRVQGFDSDLLARRAAVREEILLASVLPSSLNAANTEDKAELLSLLSCSAAQLRDAPCWDTTGANIEVAVSSALKQREATDKSGTYEHMLYKMARYREVSRLRHRRSVGYRLALASAATPLAPPEVALPQGMQWAVEVLAQQHPPQPFPKAGSTPIAFLLSPWNWLTGHGSTAADEVTLREAVNEQRRRQVGGQHQMKISGSSTDMVGPLTQRLRQRLSRASDAALLATLEQAFLCDKSDGASAGDTTVCEAIPIHVPMVNAVPFSLARLTQSYPEYKKEMESVSYLPTKQEAKYVQPLSMFMTRQLRSTVVSAFPAQALDLSMASNNNATRAIDQGYFPLIRSAYYSRYTQLQRRETADLSATKRADSAERKRQMLSLWTLMRSAFQLDMSNKKQSRALHDARRLKEEENKRRKELEATGSTKDGELPKRKADSPNHDDHIQDTSENADLQITFVQWLKQRAAFYERFPTEKDPFLRSYVLPWEKSIGATCESSSFLSWEIKTSKDVASRLPLVDPFIPTPLWLAHDIGSSLSEEMVQREVEEPQSFAVPAEGGDDSLANDGSTGDEIFFGHSKRSALRSLSDTPVLEAASATYFIQRQNELLSSMAALFQAKALLPTIAFHLERVVAAVDHERSTARTFIAPASHSKNGKQKFHSAHDGSEAFASVFFSWMWRKGQRWAIDISGGPLVAHHAKRIPSVIEQQRQLNGALSTPSSMVGRASSSKTPGSMILSMIKLERALLTIAAYEEGKAKAAAGDIAVETKVAATGVDEAIEQKIMSARKTKKVREAKRSKNKGGEAVASQESVPHYESVEAYADEKLRSLFTSEWAHSRAKRTKKQPMPYVEAVTVLNNYVEQLLFSNIRSLASKAEDEASQLGLDGYETLSIASSSATPLHPETCRLLRSTSGILPFHLPVLWHQKPGQAADDSLCSLLTGPTGCPSEAALLLDGPFSDYPYLGRALPTSGSSATDEVKSHEHLPSEVRERAQQRLKALGSQRVLDSLWREAEVVDPSHRDYTSSSSELCRLLPTLLKRWLVQTVGMELLEHWPSVGLYETLKSNVRATLLGGKGPESRPFESVLKKIAVNTPLVMSRSIVTSTAEGIPAPPSEQQEPKGPTADQHAVQTLSRSHLAALKDSNYTISYGFVLRVGEPGWSCSDVCASSRSRAEYDQLRFRTDDEDSNQIKRWEREAEEVEGELLVFAEKDQNHDDDRDYLDLRKRKPEDDKPHQNVLGDKKLKEMERISSLRHRAQGLRGQIRQLLDKRRAENRVAATDSWEHDAFFGLKKTVVEHEGHFDLDGLQAHEGVASIGDMERGLGEFEADLASIGSFISSRGGKGSHDLHEELRKGAVVAKGLGMLEVVMAGAQKRAAGNAPRPFRMINLPDDPMGAGLAYQQEQYLNAVFGDASSATESNLFEFSPQNSLMCVPKAFGWSIMNDCNFLLKIFPKATRCIYDIEHQHLAPSYVEDDGIGDESGGGGTVYAGHLFAKPPHQQTDLTGKVGAEHTGTNFFMADPIDGTPIRHPLVGRGDPSAFAQQDEAMMSRECANTGVAPLKSPSISTKAKSDAHYYSSSYAPPIDFHTAPMHRTYSAYLTPEEFVGIERRYLTATKKYRRLCPCLDPDALNGAEPKVKGRKAGDQNQDGLQLSRPPAQVVPLTDALADELVAAVVTRNKKKRAAKDKEFQLSNDTKGQKPLLVVPAGYILPNSPTNITLMSSLVSRKGNKKFKNKLHAAMADGFSILPLVHVADQRSFDCPCQLLPFAGVSEESRCLAYLANWSNVLRLEPVLSDNQFGRTAKMRVLYEHPCMNTDVIKPPYIDEDRGGLYRSADPFLSGIRSNMERARGNGDFRLRKRYVGRRGYGAMLKFPQALFPLEPYAEYAAFELDRFLRLHLVPTTSWLFVPVDELEKVVGSFHNNKEGWLSDMAVDSAVLKGAVRRGKRQAEMEAEDYVESEIEKFRAKSGGGGIPEEKRVAPRDGADAKVTVNPHARVEVVPVDDFEKEAIEAQKAAVEVERRRRARKKRQAEEDAAYGDHASPGESVEVVGKSANRKLLQNTGALPHSLLTPESVKDFRPISEKSKDILLRKWQALAVSPNQTTGTHRRPLEANEDDEESPIREKQYNKNNLPAAEDYAKWFSHDVILHALAKGLMLEHPITKVQVLGCSVQLWIAGADGEGLTMPRHSVLDYEDGYSKLLSDPKFVKVLSDPKEGVDGSSAIGEEDGSLHFAAPSANNTAVELPSLKAQQWAIDLALELRAVADFNEKVERQFDDSVMKREQRDQRRRNAGDAKDLNGRELMVKERRDLQEKKTYLSIHQLRMPSINDTTNRQQSQKNEGYFTGLARRRQIYNFAYTIGKHGRAANEKSDWIPSPEDVKILELAEWVSKERDRKGLRALIPTVELYPDAFLGVVPTVNDRGHEQLLEQFPALGHASQAEIGSPIPPLLRTAARHRNLDPVLRYLSDRLLFDTILGNGDRSCIKNANVQHVAARAVTYKRSSAMADLNTYCLVDGFGSSACLPKAKRAYQPTNPDPYVSISSKPVTLVHSDGTLASLDELMTQSETEGGGGGGEESYTLRTRFVLLDQGKSFYQRFAGPPSMVRMLKKWAVTSADPKDKESIAADGDGVDQPVEDNGSLCVFRKATILRIQALSGEHRFANTLGRLVPDPILSAIQPIKLMWAQERINFIVKQVEYCVETFGEEVVFPWD